MAILKKSLRWLVNQPILALVFLMALALVVRLVWGWQVNSQLNRRLALIRAANQPTNVSEVIYPSIAASENAWNLQMQASRALAPNIKSPGNMEGETFAYPLSDPHWLTLAERSETAHAPAFVLARQARGKSDVLIRSTLPSPVMNIILSYINDAKELACTLIDGAIYSHLKHNDDEAIERLLDALHIARSFYHDDFPLCQMVGAGFEGRVCAATRIIFSDFRPGDRSRIPAKTSQLIAQLQDEQLLNTGFARGLMFEQLIWIDYYADRASKNWLLRPLAEREIVRMLANCELLRQAAQSPFYPQAQQFLKRLPKEPPPPRFGPMGLEIHDRSIPRFSRWFHYTSDQSRNLRYYFRILAERRSTVVALAVHFYRLDHGRWPAQLADLVPTYLTALPIDPFTEDGRPIGYLISNLPNGTQRPLLFFEAGSEVPIPAEPTYLSYPAAWNAPDVRQYRDLSYFDPSLLKKTVNDHPEKSDAPGNNPQQPNKRN